MDETSVMKADRIVAGNGARVIWECDQDNLGMGLG